MGRKITLLLGLMVTAVSYGQYCTVGVGPTSTFDTNVEAVVLNGETSNINYTGCPGVTGVEDQTVQVADIMGGNSYILDVTWGTCGGNWGNAGEVWIDYNGDDVFDPGESIATVSYGGGTNFQSYGFTVPVAVTIGTHRMRVMQWEGGALPLDPCGGFTWGSVVDFTIDITGIVTCPSPSGLTLDNCTADSAMFSWTIGSAEAEWEFDYGLPGFTPGTGSPTITSDLADTIGGLMDNTTYEVYVRAVCGAGDSSSWHGPLTFTTKCLALAANGWCEDFEPSSSSENCWLINNANMDADTWVLDNPTAHTGTEAAAINTDFNGGFNDDWLISPAITLTGNEVMNFWYRVNSAFEPNDFEVLLSTTGTDPADFTETLMALDSYDNTTYLDTNVDLTAYSGDVYIAWHIPTGGLDGWILYIDDVCMNVCNPTPGTDGSTDVCRTDGNIDLDPVIVPGEATGNWVFDPSPTLVSGSMLNVLTLPEGTYDAYYIVDGACSSDTTTATINVWDEPKAGADGNINVCLNQPFNLLEGLSGADFGGSWYDESMSAVGSLTVTLSTAGSYTYYYVVSNGACPSDTAMIAVTVDSNCDYLELDDQADLAVTVYPNPTEGMLFINNSSDQVLNIEVRDLSGRIVQFDANAIAGFETTELNLAANEKGIYLVRIFNDTTEKITKVVLK